VEEVKLCVFHKWEYFDWKDGMFGCVFMSEKHYTKEPLIHSHIEDSVSSFTVNKNPKEPCTYCVACDRCGKDVQSGWECMETWVETEFGNYCTKCWHLVSVMEILEDNFAKGDNV
jgi:hypothetical protein